VIGDDEKSHPDLSAGSALGRIALLPIQTLNRPLAELEAMPNLNVGLIVTDSCRPRINGIEFIRRSQLIAPEGSVIVVTGHRREREQNESSDITRRRAILAKPLSWRVLVDEISPHWPAAQRAAPAMDRGQDRKVAGASSSPAAQRTAPAMDRGQDRKVAGASSSPAAQRAAPAVDRGP
jgi:DNA-binding NtrC family response regulator